MPLSEAARLRKPGDLKGKIWIADDFDAELPADLLVAFYGEVPEADEK
jgi:hypothetical protein